MSVVFTTIQEPTPQALALGAACLEHGLDLFVVGDAKSPGAYSVQGARYLSLKDQIASDWSLARVCPQNTYARKNIGYLEAIAKGAEVLIETDDDNQPTPAFFLPRQLKQHHRVADGDGWVNAYQFFSFSFIYPRGFPLQYARQTAQLSDNVRDVDCPVQQGLVNGDPDVDAVYRMLFPLPFDFDNHRESVILAGGAWCPFNSQNTTFFREAFPLLYLPAYCSFRMTDIWRSFVAQRILYERGIGVLFTGPTMTQARNPHDYHKDFQLELSGYLRNAEIRERLLGVDIRGKPMPHAMELCYQELIRMSLVAPDEERLLGAWFDDLRSAG